jgi:hypothetical protein
LILSTLNKLNYTWHNILAFDLENLRKKEDKLPNHELIYCSGILEKRGQKKICPINYLRI